MRRISNSEIQTFKDCKRKWYLGWHRGLTPKETKYTGALAIGTREHVALASFYVPDGHPRPDPRVELNRLLVEDWDALIKRHGGFFDIPEEVRKTFESEAELQRAMMEGYVQWLEETGADSGLSIISSEQYVEAQLTDEIIIIGRIDALAHRIADGATVFIDHKTVGDFTAKIKTLKQDEQMKMYRLILMLSGAFPDVKVAGAYYNMLRKVKRTRAAKPPFFMREWVTFNPIEMDTFKQQLRGVISDIQLAEIQLEHLPHQMVAYPRPNDQCDWKCPFKRVCPMFDDGSRAEHYLEDNFITINPLSYYDQEDVQRHGA